MKIGRLFQNQEFVFSDFNGQKIEQLIAVYNDSHCKNVVMIYLKVKNHSWHQFFLDIGIGFWENWGENEIEIDDSFTYIDKTNDFGIKNNIIEKIWCEIDTNDNSQINIKLTDGRQITLKTICNTHCKNEDRLEISNIIDNSENT
ncbi:hypothetical protein [Capnocytophaga cynodegmi]|uniref:Uncharacterized protein n=1 Tax=Capnocytophaga cynodegmi TaxID=28189 RepID=A0A0B7H716_9FLAO|nr:hypothetical protein [Capnocytophaga cynodegmi]CEN33443.1 conserved hypothetical protein [Capnocytophaga cynodegmi]